MHLNTIQCVLFGLVVQASHSLAVPTKREAVTKCLTQAKVPIDTKGSQAWTQDGSTYNVRLQFEPAAIAVPTTVAQVSAAVACGSRLGVAVNAKSGGHSYTSLGFGGEDGHLMIELDRLYSVKLAKDGTAKIQPGARLGHVATELYNQGKRALSHGTCPGVGVGGHALHGGYGMVARKYGLTLDRIKGATVVIPSGKVLHCSKTENSDLFWAIRGAGASFGVVVELEFDTFPAPEKMTYFDIGLSWNQQTAPKGLLDFQEFGKTMPAEITMQMFISKDGYSIDGAYIGDEAGLRKALQPLLTKLNVQVSASTVGWMQLVAHFAGNGDINPTSASYNATSSHSWWLQMDIAGGRYSAISKPQTGDTAYVHRDKLLLFQFYDSVALSEKYSSDGFTLIQGLRQSISSRLKEGSWGMYVNYPDSQLKGGRATGLYWGKNLARLEKVKATYDPKNIFRNPQSIQPAKA
ncbi:hypothetical protein F66182_5746 [Fusarium sp. NRRL 66182]|nr:hypothetical protein F66182_5746 [Fusarium sp. NRRL 66182]